jgi:hypothetical protein
MQVKVLRESLINAINNQLEDLGKIREIIEKQINAFPYNKEGILSNPPQEYLNLSNDYLNCLVQENFLKYRLEVLEILPYTKEVYLDHEEIKRIFKIKYESVEDLTW